jgi:hypothetical protein
VRLPPSVRIFYLSAGRHRRVPRPVPACSAPKRTPQLTAPSPARPTHAGVVSRSSTRGPFLPHLRWPMLYCHFNT